MKPLYNAIDFTNSTSLNLLPLECYDCGITFYIIKKNITYEIKHNRGRIKYCSQKCNNNVNNQDMKINVTCTNCSKSFKKSKNQIKRSENHFCSRSCSATHNNKNKTHGNRRSKLEIWLEEQLTTQYPDLKIDYNQKGAIGSELDIYIPSLKLAFELNGIFHYEPIYGDKKLNQIKENDNNKFQKCINHNISLCVIDTSQQKYFKASASLKYLDIINNIIKERLLTY
jgi:hypothetical protein